MNRFVALVFLAVCCSSLLALKPTGFKPSGRHLKSGSPAQNYADQLRIGSPYQYETRHFWVPLDNFGFETDYTFPIRYLINDTYWGGEGYPIFFYTGNEGWIEAFAENTGLMWELAPEYGALLIFAEHRYYGLSLPFGEQSLNRDDPRTGYLTSEQALADYAKLIASFKVNVTEARDSAVVSFGGSYGGMLAAWFRMKYPQITAGSIASSAPILLFEGVRPCNVYGQIVTNDFNQTSVECANTIRNSWAAIDNVTSTQDGLDWLTNEWKLCNPLTSSADVVEMKGWLSNVWTNLAMVDYPYPADFLEPLPGNPIEAVCASMTDSQQGNEDLLSSIFPGLNIYFNYTGDVDCINTDESETGAVGARGWFFQACTEMIMPICFDGVNDFFEPSPWNLEADVAKCNLYWNNTARPYMVQTNYGAEDFTGHTNIIFSNGHLDPWASGGVLQNISDSMIAIFMPGAAHHLDLRSSNPADPESVVNARNMERYFIQQWIDEYANRVLVD